MEYIHPITTMLLLMMGIHFLCDYPLQGDFLSSAKKNGPLRVWHLVGHSTIHAAGIHLITGSLVLALFELVAHSIIDELKNKNYITFAQDQFLHVICKLVWIVILFYGGYFDQLHYEGN